MITSSAQCAVNSSEEDTYLTWNNMKWNVYGNVTAYNVSKKEICKTSDGKTNFFLTGGNLFKKSLTIRWIFFKTFTLPWKSVCRHARSWKTLEFQNLQMYKKWKYIFKKLLKCTTFLEPLNTIQVL